MGCKLFQVISERLPIGTKGVQYDPGDKTEHHAGCREIPKVFRCVSRGFKASPEVFLNFLGASKCL